MASHVWGGCYHGDFFGEAEEFLGELLDGAAALFGG